MTFKYYKIVLPYDSSEVFSARIDSDIKNSAELHKSLYYLLRFPGYYGFNWDALNDCLCDFHWIDNKKIVIVHEQIPELPKRELKVYIDILNEAVLSWNNDDKHELEVWFNFSDKGMKSLKVRD